MFKNYIKTAIRNLKRYKGYSIKKDHRRLHFRKGDGRLSVDIDFAVLSVICFFLDISGLKLLKIEGY